MTGMPNRLSSTKKSLDGVRELGHRARVAAFLRLVTARAGVAWTPDLADPVAVPERMTRLLD
jgi:hypothetical protein